MPRQGDGFFAKKSRHYILLDRTPVVPSNHRIWTEWMGHPENVVVKIDEVTLPPQTAKVSTVFLGIDHNRRQTGQPVLFETMIFGGPHHNYQMRYTSWDDAVKGHEIALALARSGE